MSSGRALVLGVASSALLATGAFGAGLSVNVGVIDILANEYVWESDWKVSQLIWETHAPVLTFGLAFSVNRFTVDADLSIAFSGNSHMEDYDWLEPYVVANGPDDWTHQSIHPDTNLALYLQAGVTIGFDIVSRDRLSVNLNGGFRYTDVMWDALGGSYTYSVGGFRDTVGDLPDGQPSISYRQQWPVVFGGIDLQAMHGSWTFAATVQGGVTVGPIATDDHWLRDLRFIDTPYRAPVIHVGVRVENAVTETFSIFVEGSFDKIFEARADTSWFAISTGNPQGGCLDCAGAGFRSFSVGIGLSLALGGAH